MATGEMTDKKCDELVCTVNALLEKINREKRVEYETEDKHTQRLVSRLTRCAAKTPNTEASDVRRKC